MTSARYWRTIADSTLIPLFQADTGWAAFRSRYGAHAQFAMISQPLIVGETATLVAATAQGELNGRGVILQFVRDASGHWIKRAEAWIWTS